MKAILLIMIGLSISLLADTSRNNEIVTDNETGLLQWQDNADAKTKTLTWSSAIDYCEALELGGYSDWRLPNINELKSIVDRTKANPAIVNGFENVSSDYYWSATTTQDGSDYAWVVDFYDGNVDFYGKNHNFYVRCVRAGQ